MWESLLLLKKLLEPQRIKFKIYDNFNINTYHFTIKMKHVDVKANRYIDFNKENKKESNFEVGDQVIISK